MAVCKGNVKNSEEEGGALCLVIVWVYALR